MSDLRPPPSTTTRISLSRTQQTLLPHGTEIHLAVGETLPEKICDNNVGFVLQGQLTLTWHQDAKRSGIAVLLPGDWFGEHNLLLGAAPARLDLKASAFAAVRTIPADALTAMLAEELAPIREHLQRELSASVTERWAQLAARLHQRMHLGTDECVWEALVEAAAWPSAMSHPEGTLVRAPRDVIAQRVGCSRVTVSRALSRLVATGRIRLEGRRILLLVHRAREDGT
ncbi:MAG: Crp/Fnr family transcriptional regulator [Thiohalocapsa sp.]|nr:Crp/Fnr family transcriptional regulator [Thiohalocapsa sp.]MCF7990930.1 Crp/Fnr family transcriptional regulator [Thiohalocapsa sp.]